MKNERRSNVTKKICFAAIFAAMCCACTLISIPIPIGYINLGDLMVLTAGWCLGGGIGAVAAGVGSALADVILGYVVYSPATFIIKALVAIVAALVYPVFKKTIFKNTRDFLPRIISALLAECVMVGGYFLFECGIGQAFLIEQMLLCAGFSNPVRVSDYGGVVRVVGAKK